MKSESNLKGGFSGRTVVTFESRMADQMAKLISRYGGTPLIAPSMQAIPLENNPEALAFADQLMAGSTHMLVLLTGVGTRTLVDVWKTRFSMETIHETLNKVTLVARGPKSAAVLKELGLKADISVPEPNTWKDILKILDKLNPEGLQGIKIGVQEYGEKNEYLLDGLTDRGAQVTRVPVYRWALPDNVEPLKQGLKTILGGGASVVLFTSAVQVDHIVDMLKATNKLKAFPQVLEKIMVASIGPITSQRLKQYHFPVDFEPSHSKMGTLVKEVSEKVGDFLERKQNKRTTY